eukprot:superscaffoldBa00004665_g19259
MNDLEEEEDGAKSLISSCLSIKSDRSKRDPLNFSNGPGPSDTKQANSGYSMGNPHGGPKGQNCCGPGMGHPTVWPMLDFCPTVGLTTESPQRGPKGQNCCGPRICLPTWGPSGISTESRVSSIQLSVYEE